MTATFADNQDVSAIATLRAALAAVSAAYAALPLASQEAIEIVYDGLDQEIDAALLSGDRDRALRAIRAWHGHWIATFEGKR